MKFQGPVEVIRLSYSDAIGRFLELLLNEGKIRNLNTFFLRRQREIVTL